VYGPLSPNPSNAAGPLSASDTLSVSAADSVDPPSQSPTPPGAKVAGAQAASIPPAASNNQHISAPGNAGTADTAEPFPASTITDETAANNNAAIQEAPQASPALAAQNHFAVQSAGVATVVSAQDRSSSLQAAAETAAAEVATDVGSEPSSISNGSQPQCDALSGNSDAQRALGSSSEQSVSHSHDPAAFQAQPAPSAVPGVATQQQGLPAPWDDIESSGAQAAAEAVSESSDNAADAQNHGSAKQQAAIPGLGAASEEMLCDPSTDGASQASNLHQAQFQYQATQADISPQASSAAWSPAQGGAPLDSDSGPSNTSNPSSAMTDAIKATSSPGSATDPGSSTEPGDQSATRRIASDTSAAGESINQVPAQANDNLQQHQQPAQQPEDDEEEDDQEVISDTESDIAAQLGNINEGAAAPECAVPNDGANAENPPTAPPGFHGSSNVIVPTWYIHNPPSSFGGHLSAALLIWLTGRNRDYRCRLRRHGSDT